MIVVREDRKPLDVEYMAILYDWILSVILPLFRQARSDCLRIDREVTSETARSSQKRAARRKAFRHLTKKKLLAYSRGRLTNEDTEDEEDEEVANIVENEDTTDDGMPCIGEEAEARDDGDLS